MSMGSRAIPEKFRAVSNPTSVDLLSRLVPSTYVASEEPDPAVDSSFRLGSVAQLAIGHAALSAAYLHELRTGVPQTVSVSPRHAVVEFKSEIYYTVNGKLTGSGSLWDSIAGLYKTKDNSYVRIHTNFPHHRQRILDILHCEPTKESVAQALLTWNSFEFEEKAASRGMVATALRSFTQWDEHPHSKALQGVLPVTITKVGEAPKRIPRGRSDMPLAGMRVLDLTRVLAGPVCGRTLAAYGADVLLVTSPRLPDLPDLDVDTSRGKRTTQLDLTDENDSTTLKELVRGADVFLQAYRPGGLAKKGFGVSDVVAARPGIVYASLCAYGFEGPWKDRRGFDSLVQTATGFNVAEGEAYSKHTGEALSSPRPLPMQALDHAAGYFLAAGINSALCRTITEGGSWEVRVSLAAVGQWIRSLGQLEDGFTGPPLPKRAAPPDREIAMFSAEYAQAAGDKPLEGPQRTMTAIRHAAEFSVTPAMEKEAPMRLNAHLPRWLPRDGDVLA